MSDNNNNNQQQQQQPQTEPNYDLQGNLVRGRAGNLMGLDRGPMRGGAFEAIDPRAFDASPQGASSSIQGWVLMISNLSPATTESDLREFLADVDPTMDMFGQNNNNNGNGNENNNNTSSSSEDPTAQSSRFISDLKMHMSAKNVQCLGHAFVKTPRLAWAYKIQSLNGREFVDDLPVSVDFAFRVPPVSNSEVENNNNNNNNTSGNIAVGKQRDRGIEEDHSADGPHAPARNENDN